MMYISDPIRVLKGNFEGSFGRILSVNDKEKIVFAELEGDAFGTFEFGDFEVIA